ncbi:MULTISPECIES: DUF4097 family beta strand repeat-containing protein [Streptomyces]|uniref:DUF4097 family beta strand repeat-containing protein n=1 Tax=Streptomyces TaxID=1883 RepID=UPI000BD0AC23|nr:Putative adhesin [Streptomyces sp. 1222.2]
MSEWSVAEPQRLTFDEPVTALHVRVVNGTVNVVGTDESSARLEVSAVEGPPLTVTQKGGTLTVAYDDLPWKGFLKWLDRKGWRRNVLVSLAVPAATRVEVGVVGATAVVTGLEGHTEVKGVSGDATLVGLAGPVRATTVSGNVEAQSLSGDLRLSSVSGDLTVIEGSCPTVKADSVSGSIILDLDPTGGPTDVGLTSVSGEIAIRLPHPTDAQVEANTASGTISNAFEDLRVSGPWGAHKITGRLGAGNGRLRATTVSGSIALLRRPPSEDEPWEPGSGGRAETGGPQRGDSAEKAAEAGRNPGARQDPPPGTPDATPSGSVSTGLPAADRPDDEGEPSPTDPTDGHGGPPPAHRPEGMSDHPSDGSSAPAEEPSDHAPAPDDGPDAPGADRPAGAATDRTTDKKVF